MAASSGPAIIRSAALHGIDALPVEVEVDVLPGLPSFTVVGLTDRAIQESRERLTSALSNLGFAPPRRKTIVSLAPASLKKEGSLYDVPIALGYLIASGQLHGIASQSISEGWFVGELGLDGAIRAVRGVLPIVRAAVAAGATQLYVPHANAHEAASLADEIAVYAVSSLQELLTHLQAKDESQQLASLPPKDFPVEAPPADIDFSDIRGQDHAKRALMVAAAGGHNVLLVGPPGTGKTLLARAMVGILPALRREEAYIVTSLYSVAGLLPEGAGLIMRRPFRSPHHGASGVALVGGGANPKPGEVSLAHHGVLFLDELPEFSRHVLEQLRQPIEDGVVTVSRAVRTVQYPARSMLVGAMNPCPCGFIGSERKACKCSAAEILRYQRRVSGPLLDRFDLHVLVADVPAEELLEAGSNEKTSPDLAQAVFAARSLQLKRFGKTTSELSPREIEEEGHLDEAGRKLLFQAEERFALSARSIHRLLKVSLTIASLEKQDTILPHHLAEALQYREQLRQALPDFV